MRSSASARCATPCRSQRLWVLATAACRDARNGKDFIAAAEQICRTKIDVISGQREAELTALGVVSGFHRPDGIVGDLGGGSLELVDVHGARIKPGTTLPLGGLALQDRSGRSIKKAEKIVKDAFDDLKLLQGRRGPHLLRGRRHLAGAGATAHGADGLSAARHARLRHPRARRRWSSPGWCAGSIRTRCRRSRW